MRYLVIVIVFIVVGASCKSKRSHFEIKGKIIHAKRKKLLLKQLTIGIQNPVLIDTAIINNDGSFDMKTFMPLEQDLFVLTIENGPDVYLVNDRENINLNLDINHYKSYTIDGSPSSKQLHEFLNAYNDNYKLLIDKINEYDSIQKSTATDSIVLIKREEKDASLVKINQLIINNIKQSPNPAIHSYLIAKSFATMQKEGIAKLIADSRIQFKNYHPLQFLEEVIKHQKQENKSEYPLLNHSAPTFSMEDIDAKVFDLDSIKGKYVLLDFWASWSKPSREENINIALANRRYKRRGLTIIGISLDSIAFKWRNAVDEDNLYWTHVSDLQAWNSSIVRKYKVNTLPFTVLIDTTKKIIGANLRGRDLTMKLNEVLPK
jgi:peroxiredoxin